MYIYSFSGKQRPIHVIKIDANLVAQRTNFLAETQVTAILAIS